MLTFCLQILYNIVVISILNRANIRHFFLFSKTFCKKNVKKMFFFTFGGFF